MPRRKEAPLPSQDSEDEDHVHPIQKRQKTHRFKTFARRVAEINVDVYRSLEPKRSEPLPGNSSFLEEKLNSWRELNAAKDWLEVAAELQPLCQSLAQVVHHQQQILDIILSRVRIDAILSLEPLFDMVAALARDIQNDFEPYLPRVLEVYTNAIDSGLLREPEVLQHLFASLSLVCKHLQKVLAQRLSMVLAVSAGIRYHAAAHVRALAAQCFGYLLRHVSGNETLLRSSLRRVLADAVAKPSTARLHGVGTLIAESVMGVKHGLHSRGPVILQLLLAPSDTLLTEKDFESGKSVDDDTKTTHSSKINDAVISSRIASVSWHCLKRLLEHVRRTESGTLSCPWAILIDEVTLQLNRVESGSAEACGASLTNALLLLASMVAYHRGSRVEDYGPLFRVSHRLVTSTALTVSSEDVGSFAGDLILQAKPGDVTSEDLLTRFNTAQGPRHAALTFLLSIIFAHCKVAGASEGPQAISTLAPTWSSWALAPGYPLSSLAFAKALMSPPCGRDIVASFVPGIVKVISAVLVTSKNSQDMKLPAWTILTDLCSSSFHQFSLTSAAPQLAEYVIQIIKRGSVDEESLKAARCLPHALAHSKGLPALLRPILPTYRTAMVQSSSPIAVKMYSSLWKLTVAAEMQGETSADERLQHAERIAVEAVDLLSSFPHSAHVIEAINTALDANEVMATIRRDSSFGLSSVQQLMQQLTKNLESSSATLRQGTLQLLHRLFDDERSTVFKHLLAVKGSALDRSATVSLSRVGNILESGLISDPLALQCVVSGLLGVLYIKLATLWPPASAALGIALTVSPKTAAPLVLDALRRTQSEFFCNSNNNLVEKNGSDDVDTSQDEMVENTESYTDTTTRLTYLLRALTAAPSTANEVAEQWVPLFFEFTEHSAGRAWRLVLREWLILLAKAGKKKSFLKGSSPKDSQAVQDLLNKIVSEVMRLCNDPDEAVQKSALEALGAFKLPWLQPYLPSLLRLATDSTLRSEMTSFPLSPTPTSVREGDAVDAILPEHRPHIVPLIISILYPKMRKRSGRLGGKGAPGSARTAILNFLSAALPAELSRLIALILEPLASVFRIPSHKLSSLLEHGDVQDLPYWCEVIDVPAVTVLPRARRVGALNSITDLSVHLGASLQSYLPIFLPLVLAIYESAVSSEEALEEDDASLKEVRSKSLRLLASLILRFPTSCCDAAFPWARLFTSCLPAAKRVKSEADSSSLGGKKLSSKPLGSHTLRPKTGSRPPALVELCTAIAESPELSRMLFVSPHPSTATCLESCLAAPTSASCSVPTVKAVLNLVERLCQEGLEGAVDPYLSTVLAALQTIVHANTCSSRALDVLELLASRKLASEKEREFLTDALLGLIASKTKKLKGKGASNSNSNSLYVVNRALDAFTALWTRPPVDTTTCFKVESSTQLKAMAATISSLLTQRNGLGQDTLDSMCGAANAIAISVPEFSTTAKLLTEMNARDGMEDGPDYERRIAAYGLLTPDLWGDHGQQPWVVEPLVHRCILDLGSEDDLILRQAAARGLEHLIDSRHQALCQDVLYRMLVRDLAHVTASLTVLSERLALLRKLIITFPTEFANFVPLTHLEQEADVLLNMGHIQVHRRARAYARLQRSIDTGAFNPAQAIDIVLPLIRRAILSTGSAAESGVVDAAIGALAATARVLDWPRYRNLLDRYLRDVVKADTKPVIRALCTVLEAYNKEDCEDPELEKEGKEHDQVEKDKAFGAMLASRVVPQLHNLLVEGETVRAPIALAMVKVLKYGPAEILRTELPRTLQTVANLLKLRLQRLRDDARAVLVDIAKELGPDGVPFTINILCSSLPTRGFTAHVLGYTVHGILQAVAPKWLASLHGEGEIDGKSAFGDEGREDALLDAVLPIIEEDLFGERAEAKEVDSYAVNYKEVKKSKGQETMGILASMVGHQDRFLVRLLSPIRAQLQEGVRNPKTKAILEQLLRHISRGILNNPALTAEHLCEFTYAMVHSFKKSNQKGQTLENETSTQDLWLLVEFALSTLYAGMKKGVVRVGDQHTAVLLSPLLPHLLGALRSRHPPTVTAALRILNFVLASASTENSEESVWGGGEREMAKAVSDLLSTCPTATHPIARACFELMAGMLRRSKRFAPTPAQIRALLSWGFSDLEGGEERKEAFSLLRVILSRKITLPEVYDVMDKVQEVAIRAQSPGARHIASSALLAFFLDYPLGTKRLEAHLNFLLSNACGYTHESGRAAALDTLRAIVEKLPSKLLSSPQWAETLFLPLVTRLINEPSSQCKSLAGTVISLLITRCDVAARDRLAGYCLRWLENVKLARVGARGLGIFVDVEPKGVKRIPATLPIVSRLLTQDDWQTIYQCLVLLEKVMTVAPETLQVSQAAKESRDQKSLNTLTDVWTSVCHLLEHSHAWVMKAAARVLGAGLGRSEICDDILNLNPGKMSGLLARSLFSHIDNDLGDEAMVGQAVKCLVFLTDTMYVEDHRAGNGLVSCDENVAEPERMSMAALIRGMVRLADDRSYVRKLQRETGIRFVAAIVSRLGKERIASYLPVLLGPLYKLTAPNAISQPNVQDSEEIVSLARDVLDHVKNVIGTEAFLAAYEAAREGVKRVGAKRKQRQAVTALVDPEAAAKRKIRAAQRKAAGKKKALEEVRRMRAAGIVVKNKKGGGGKPGKRELGGRR